MKNLSSLILRDNEEAKPFDILVINHGSSDFNYEIVLHRTDSRGDYALAAFNNLDDVIFFLWSLYTGRASASIFSLDHLPKGRIQFPQSVLRHEFQHIEDRFHLEDELPARNWNVL